MFKVIHCEFCGGEFKTNVTPYKTTHNTIVKFCGRGCYWESLKGKKLPRSIAEKIGASNKGREVSPKTRELIRQRALANEHGNYYAPGGTNKDANHPRWMGDGASYPALHQWVKRNLGRATLCKSCGSTKRVEWSNISWEYKRDLDDWQQLCSKCHKAYDKQNLGAALRLFDLRGTGQRL